MKLLGSLRHVIGRRRIIRDLQHFDTEAKIDGYWTFKNDITEALEVFERGNTRRAKEIWMHTYAKFPEQALHSQPAVGLLLKLCLFDDLEHILACGLKRYPSDVRLLAASALAAYEGGQFEETLRRCKKLRKKYPTNARGYWIAAAAMSRLERFIEAEGIFVKALQVLPGDPGLLIEYAKLAERAKDWITALQRWNKLFEMCKHLAGISGAAVALAYLGRFDEADELLASIRYRAGTEHLIWMASARVAEIKVDWEEAARRWETYRNRFPLRLEGYFEGLRPLRELSRDADIEVVLQDGVDRFSHEAKLVIEYARLAHRRQDWNEAARRWAAVRQHFPKNLEGYLRGAEALDALGCADDAREVRRNELFRNG